MKPDYTTDFWRSMYDLHGFSFYRKPIQNIEPCRAITVVDVYRYLVSHYAKAQTDTLRSLSSPSKHSSIVEGTYKLHIISKKL